MRIALVGMLMCAALSGQGTALDRLGRTTPKSSLLGFLRSAHEGNFAKSAHYMQFGPETAEKERVEIARQLSFVLDRGFIGNIDTMSSKPEGALDDGLPSDRETIGAVIGAEQSSPVQMVRVGEAGQQVWLLARETVELVPQLFPEFGFPRLERWLPRVLIDTRWLSMPVWVLLAVLFALPVAVALAWGLCRLAIRFMPSAWAVAPRPGFPVVMFLALVLHYFASRLLGLPLLYRVWYVRMLTVLWLAAWVWAIFSVISHVDFQARDYLRRKQLQSTQSMLQLGRRLLQIFVLFGAVLIGLRSFGFDITAALAGLGIGSIAIALAAQKTLENVFGGLALLSDQSIRVGDSCRFGTTVGTVEDIGLRATSFRTVQRSVLYVPNGQLASMNIENLGKRDRILFEHTVNVKYGLSPEAIEKLAAALRTLLSDERILVESRRVRFVKLGVYALEIEIFAYLLTNDAAEYLQIQEELLLKIMRVVTEQQAELVFFPPRLPSE